MLNICEVFPIRKNLIRNIVQTPSLITVNIFASTLVDHLANLDCAVSEPVKEHLASLLLEVFFSRLLNLNLAP